MKARSDSAVMMDIPPIGMGTGGMGGIFIRDDSNAQQSVDSLRAGLALGFRLIDTAELYGQGLTEMIVEEAMRGFDRSNIFLITKVSREHLAYADVRRAIEGSLQRLKTTYVDLYLVHKENPDIPLSQTMKAMEEIVDEGLARYIGVSNFSDMLAAEARSHLTHTAIAANQIEFNLFDRSAEETTIPYCQKNNLRIIAQRPFAKGKAITRSTPIVDSLAKKYGKTRAQIILNWIMAKGMVPIPKAMDESHLRDNFGALGWTMEKADALLLDGIRD